MNITILSVPYNLDQLRVGMGRAPETLAQLGLADQLAAHGHDVAAETITIPPSDAGREERIGQVQAALADAVRRTCAAGRLPLIIGGDCLASLGAVAGLGKPESTGILWIDAHGDFNTPEISVSGYLGGMPLACAVGRGLPAMRAACGLVPVPERNVAIIGARDLDPLEEQALADSAVTVVRADAVMQNDSALEQAIESLSALPHLYVHIDIDVLDMADAPGVDFPTPNGLHVGQLQGLVRRAARLGNLAALALTAVNPERDADGRTVRAALEIIGAALC